MENRPLPLISVVIPAKNAEHLIGRCLKSLRELDYPKDKLEIIIADGLSTDRTAEIAAQYGASVVANPGIRVVAGRNVGFAASRGEFVAFSDADCTMRPDWLKNCVKYFDDKKVAGIGGPNLVPADETNFGKAVGLFFDYGYFLVKGTAPTKILDKVIESRAHGSNAIYRREALTRVMPVDEAMAEGEDVIMNEQLKDLGYKLLYVPDVIVYHMRRPTPRKWWKQMAGYSRGRVLMRRKRSGILNPLHYIVGLLLPALAIIVVLGILINRWLLVLLVGGALLVAASSFVFAWLKSSSARVALNMPLVIFIMALAWSWGFLKESFGSSSPKLRRSAQ